MTNRRLIGLCGDATSGKDYVCGLLETRGFKIINVSNALRDEIRDRGLTPSRRLQTDIANELRQTRGGHYLIQKALGTLAITEPQTPIVLSALYAPVEADYIKNQGGLVIAVRPEDDSRQSQYERLSARSDGKRDDLSAEEFDISRVRENSGNTSVQANTSEVLAQADFTLINNFKGPESLNRQIDLILQERS